MFQLAEAVGQDLVREELIGHYVLLLKDNEAEVRTAAAGQIPGNCSKTHQRYASTNLFIRIFKAT